MHVDHLDRKPNDQKASGDIDLFATVAGSDVVDTHWGTRMVCLTDSDGRPAIYEPRSASS
jgi:hypothetical protein